LVRGPGEGFDQDLSRWGDRHEALIRQHLGTDSVDARHELFLRMLYSPLFSVRVLAMAQSEPERVPPRSRLFLASIPPAKLAREQEARQRNLANHIARACPRLTSQLTTQGLGPLVARFCDTPFFWREHGRSLGENFCLYVSHGEARAKDALIRSLARLDGVCSGLPNRSSATSPWTGESTATDELGILASETVYLERALFDREHRLLAPDDLRHEDGGPAQIIEVQFASDGSVHSSPAAVFESP
jgi:hypothetical protein